MYRQSGLIMQLTTIIMHNCSHWALGINFYKVACLLGLQSYSLPHIESKVQPYCKSDSHDPIATVERCPAVHVRTYFGEDSSMTQDYHQF